jgi:N-acetylmuramoyl-L-alanine amidase
MKGFKRFSQLFFISFLISFSLELILLKSTARAKNSKRIDLPQEKNNTLLRSHLLPASLENKPCDLLIDAGHGGSDIGTRHLSVTEKNLSLIYSKKLHELFTGVSSSSYGNLTSQLSRSDDIFLSLEERKKIANAFSCRFFLGLHFNSHRKETLARTEIYFGQNAFSPIKESLTEADFLDITSSLKISFFHEQSRTMAFYLKSKLQSRLPNRELLIGTLPLQVLNHTQRPSLLIEIGYLSNTEDAQLLQQQEFINSFTQALAASLSEAFKLYFEQVHF